ncbi:MAG: peptidoglycan-binding domain-containing protein, partial [Paenisporosarcina sp.]
LRGLCNRSPKSDRITILVLLGLDETPTDILLENLAAAEQLVTARWPGGLDIEGEELKSIPLPPVGNFNFQCQLPTTYNFNEPSVHIFELIEFLAYWGYYKGRNDGIYGSITRQAVRELQADLREGNLYHKRIDGVYGRYTREAFCTYMKQASQ